MLFGKGPALIEMVFSYVRFFGACLKRLAPNEMPTPMPMPNAVNPMMSVETLSISDLSENHKQSDTGPYLCDASTPTSTLTTSPLEVL